MLEVMKELGLRQASTPLAKTNDEVNELEEAYVSLIYCYYRRKFMKMSKNNIQGILFNRLNLCI